MSLCGWNFSTKTNDSRPSTEYSPQRNIKVSMADFELYSPNQPRYPAFYKHEESLLTNTDTHKINTTWQQNSPQPRTVKRRGSFIDDLEIQEPQNKIIDSYPHFRTEPRQNNMHTPLNPEQPQIPHFQNNYPQNQSTNQTYSGHQNSPSYAQLLKENHELLRQNRRLNQIVEKQYKPLRQQYDKLKEQQEDRDFLISQLEWKVKELAKDLKNKKYNYGR